MCSLRIYKGSYAKESGLNLDPFMIHERSYTLLKLLSEAIRVA